MKPVDICMLVHNTVTGDSRVRKEAATLAAQGWRVVVVGMSLVGPLPPLVETMDGFTVIRVAPQFLRRTLPGKTGQRLRLLASFILVPLQLRRVNARVYHAHDFLELLLVALAMIWQRPVVYDSHELYFDQKVKGKFVLNDLMQMLRPLEKILARRAAAVITVSEPVADRLVQTLGIPRPLVLQNVVDQRNFGEPVPYPVTAQKIVVHSGGLVVGRHLPELVEALVYLPKDIVMVLMGDGPLKGNLLDQATQLGIAEQLVIVPPVPVNSVSPTLAQADAAAVVIESQALNYRYSLPNKFFEAIAAGLPLVVSPIPAVDELVKRYDLGISCDPDDPHNIAEAILKVLEPETNARYRANSIKAKEIFNWETEEQKLITLYQSLIPDMPTSR